MLYVFQAMNISMDIFTSMSCALFIYIFSEPLCVCVCVCLSVSVCLSVRPSVRPSYMYVCVPTVCLVPLEPEKSIRPDGTRVVDGSELPGKQTQGLCKSSQCS